MNDSVQTKFRALRANIYGVTLLGLLAIAFALLGRDDEDDMEHLLEFGAVVVLYGLNLAIYFARAQRAIRNM